MNRNWRMVRKKKEPSNLSLGSTLHPPSHAQSPSPSRSSLYPLPRVSSPLSIMHIKDQDPFANMCLISVVIDVNISFLPLVSTVSYFATCIEDWIVEDIEKINEDQCMQTIWLCRGLYEEVLVKFSRVHMKS